MPDIIPVSRTQAEDTFSELKPDFIGAGFIKKGMKYCAMCCYRKLTVGWYDI